MSDEKNSVISDLLDGESIPPDYQRFIAINIQVPIAAGKRVYHRVTITGSHRDLANDLARVLPKRVRTMLERSDELVQIKDSHFEFPHNNPYRDAYIAVCSCGIKDCEHIEYAVRHFMSIQAFAENSGRISELVRENKQKATEAELVRKGLEQDILLLGQERQELAKKLEAAEQSGTQVAQLQQELESKDLEMGLLRQKIVQEDEEQARLEREIANYQDNLKSVFTQFWQEKDEIASDETHKMSEEFLAVFSQRFLPPPSQVSPSNKFQKTVEADHHRVGNTELVLAKLAPIEFIRELGIGRRRNTK